MLGGVHTLGPWGVKIVNASVPERA
jgi:hypothetical protein